MNLMRSKLLASLLATVLALGGVPAPALAEVAEEANAEETASPSTEARQAALDEAVKTVVNALDGESDAERLVSLWDLLAAVEVQEAAKDDAEDADEQALAALEGRPSTAAGVARALLLAARSLGLECSEVEGEGGRPVVETVVDGTAWRLDAAAGEPGTYPWDGAEEDAAVEEDANEEADATEDGEDAAEADAVELLTQGDSAAEDEAEEALMGADVTPSQAGKRASLPRQRPRRTSPRLP